MALVLKRSVCVALLAAAGAVAAAPAADTARKMPTLKEQVAIVKALQPGMAIVEYRLRYDKGQAPQGVAAFTTGGGDELIRQKRPLEVAGFVVGPTTVVSEDLGLHERFVESVSVRFGDSLVPARMEAYGSDHNAVFLSARPPAAYRPLDFGSPDSVAALALTCGRADGVWGVTVEGVPATVEVEADGRTFRSVGIGSLILDVKGRPMGVAMDGRLPLDSSWRGNPLGWLRVTAAARTTALERVQRLCESALLLVTLTLRSPRSSGANPDDEWHAASMRGENVTATEAHAVGVALPGNRVLVLADLSAEATARLSRAVVSDASGAAHEARFAGTLSEFGGLMLALDKPLGASVRLSTASVTDLRCRMLVKAHVAMVGSERVAHYWHGRVLAFEPGYRGVLYPHIESDESDLFFFTPEGELLALPLAERRPPAAQHDDSYDAAAPLPSASVAVLAPVLADLAAHLDTSNVPRSEEEEGRIAWMGVVLQPLDRELARANGVADQTDDGASGALVAYVYPASPAAKAGIQAGMVLLRIEAASQSRPIKVKIERESWEEPFPWDQLDEVPDEYLDRIPAPWPVEENDFNRTLTELGFGEKYRVEFVGKGSEFGRDFVVSESPPHYGSAPRWKSEKLGVTVRDLTYEVRRHYQKTPKDPGIIVSRVEPGSRAAVAGLRPYELITHVDGEAVRSAAEFGALVAKAHEVKLSVERMSRMRQVRIAM